MLEERVYKNFQRSIDAKMQTGEVLFHFHP